MGDRSGRHSRLTTQWLSIVDTSTIGDRTSTTRASLSDRKKEFRLIALLLTPAIITTFVFLGLYWDEEKDCNQPLREWCLVEACRLMVSITLSWLLQRDVQRTEYRIAKLERAGRLMSWFSFAWFVLGHIWLAMSQGNCRENGRHLLDLTAALIILQYAIMLLPLIVLIILTPFVCLCLPCLIQGFLFVNKSPVKGASKKEINQIPTRKFSHKKFKDNGYDEQCAICIADFDTGETARILKCRHVYHKKCVDNWLALNGTCPICRAPVTERARKEQDRARRDARNDQSNIELVEHPRTISVEFLNVEGGDSDNEAVLPSEIDLEAESTENDDSSNSRPTEPPAVPPPSLLDRLFLWRNSFFDTPVADSGPRQVNVSSPEEGQHHRARSSSNLGTDLTRLRSNSSGRGLADVRSRSTSNLATAFEPSAGDLESGGLPVIQTELENVQPH
mmetsp:Transcript_7242/g.11557  ORF Transcript_7242/g.11557 Transcript_7242/m.11557 type:complete len:448 (+) Transcript_7242:231-1574(+)